MDILLQKSYEINNLISLTGKFTSKSFQSALKDIINRYKEYAINRGEYIITTTKSVDVVNNEKILDIEILLPVLDCFSCSEPYKLKKTLKITNALYARVEDISNLQEALVDLEQYIINEGIQPITSTYLIQTKQNSKICVDIYIGINPNIL